MDPLRLALGAAGAGLAVLWFRNLARAGVRRDTWYAPGEGLAIALPQRALLVASILGLGVWLVRPSALAWAALPLPSWLRWLGAPLAAGGLLLLAWVLRALGENFSTSIVVRTEQTLIQSGPYRTIRHPMYTAFVLLWTGFLLLPANWFVGGTGLLAFAIAMFVRGPREERLLVERFGQEYEAYRARTGRFLPRLRR